MCSLFDSNDKPSVAVYKAIGIACGFVVSGTKKLVQQVYTQINLLIVSYALNTFRGINKLEKQHQPTSLS
ncbi:hypothetical protein VCRA2121O157_20133 [Vibrio crassostreae]|nr:hypothetical protein VCRA2113O137_130131 [Vibrio crassostreae]CAK1994393.1 hypothetical protein VCRA2113O140_20133 [Vibrio crassostreae]CAK1998476.1 hypothetical protein VCRA2113O138_20203 [Vibrio crassostreae]CAK2322463.1 hypothetical protein VCRA2116O141_20133 [Vibrio crassostreae]CAK2661025.1 hypothetical protein VCRA2119O149_1640006 [Vibrio crassostreae]